MKFDYLSDIHCDFRIGSNKAVTEGRVRNVFDSIFKPKSSDYLIIAGDISEYVTLTSKVLKAIKYFYKYKKIFFVLGNHDLWLSSSHQADKYRWDYKNKVSALKLALKDEEDIVLLDGDIYELDGITIGGSMGMWDASYDYKNYRRGMYQPCMDIMDFYEIEMNDYKYLKLPNLYTKGLIDLELDKILKVLQKSPDIMISHYCPVTSDSLVHQDYKGDRNNSFYMFDFEDYIYEYSPKVWVHGHIHSELDIMIGNTRLLRNPIGYPRECKDRQLKNFEI